MDTHVPWCTLRVQEQLNGLDRKCLYLPGHFICLDSYHFFKKPINLCVCAHESICMCVNGGRGMPVCAEAKGGL